MADPHGAQPEADHDSAPGTHDEPVTGTPRWVIVSGIVALVLIVAFATFHLAGGGFVGHVPPIGGQ